MLIIGAKGFAKEVLEILHQNGQTENLCFYDDKLWLTDIYRLYELGENGKNKH